MKARFLALAALVLGLASCQTEPEGLNVNVGGEVDTTVTVTIPDTETRAGGDNSALSVFDNSILEDENTTMRYILEIYYGDIMAERQVQFSDEQKTIAFPVRLVPNRHYNFVVWADVVTKDAGEEQFSDSDYHYNTTSKTNADGIAYGLDNISLKDTWVAMDESRDAFTGYHDTEVEGTKYTGNLPINITLTRPFAKLRVITTDVDDLDKLQIYPHHATVVYTTKHRASFDATDGTYADASIEKTHTYDIVAYGDNVDNEQQVLFTDYFFADNDVVKFEMDVFEQNNASIKNNTFNTDIPVKRNHLTTIAGDILTEGNNVSVIVNPVFENATTNPDEDEHYIEVWDGVAIEKPAYNETTKTYTVKDGAELAWIAQQVNNGKKFSGETVVLSKNICLGGHEWTPIGGAKFFEGTFDGNGKTVGDFKVTEQDGHAGLFGNAHATIKNLTVKNVTIVACHYAGGIVGQGYVRMDNCHVDGIDITLSTKNGDWGDKAGGLVGQNCEGGLYIKNSTAKNVKIQGYRDMGGIAGMAHRDNIVTGCSVENIAIFQDLSVNYESTTPTTMAGVVGRVHNNIGEYSNNNESNVEISVIITEGLTQNVDSDVYTVTSAEGMQAMVEIVEEENGAEIVLGGDIDLSELVITRSTVSNWTPIGTSEKPFSGTFDGNGKTIKNLALVESEAKEGKAYIGFFGYAKNATIKNVTFENVYINIPCLDIDHSQGHIGAVAGSLEGTSTIENVTVKGDITVYATQTANGASRVAVVAGGNAYGDVTMKNVHVVANEGSSLIANNNAGALAGQLQGKMVFENCSSNIDVTVNKFFAGGLVGIAAGDSYIKNCHTTGKVSVVAGREGRHNDEYRVGGIAGGWADGKTKVCTLEGCTYSGQLYGANADGAVVENFDYAGYVGRGYTLSNCAGSTVIIDGMKYVQVRDDVYGKYYYTGAIMDLAGVKAVVFESGDGFKAVSLEQKSLNGLYWQDAMDWATKIGQGWSLASIYDLNDIHAARKAINAALAADNADNALFAEKIGSVDARYMSSTMVPDGNDANGNSYFPNRVFFKLFNDRGYSDVPYSAFDCINIYAPLKDFHVARAVYSLGMYNVGDIVTVGGQKAIVYSITEDGAKAVSVEQGGEMTWDESMAWAEGLGSGWSLASLEDMQAIYGVRFALNRALAADNANNVLFEEDNKEEDGTYAAYWTSTLVEGTSGATQKAYYFYFDAKGRETTSFTMFPVDYSRAVYTIK